MCDEPSATSDPTGSHTLRQRFCPDCRLGTQPGHLPGFQGFREDSCFQNSVQLLQCTASAPVYSAIRHASSPIQSLVVLLVLSRLDYGNATLAGLPGRELNRFQSVLNAAARLIFAASKYDHVIPLLCDLHWLRVPECIDFKIAVLVYLCLHDLAPAHLSTELQSVKDMPSRQRLRSWSSDTLAVPTSRLSTVGDRAFPVIAARVCMERSACGRYLVDHSASYHGVTMRVTMQYNTFARVRLNRNSHNTSRNVPTNQNSK